MDLPEFARLLGARLCRDINEASMLYCDPLDFFDVTVALRLCRELQPDFALPWTAGADFRPTISVLWHLVSCAMENS
jgi:hypothetical protein